MIEEHNGIKTDRSVTSDYIHNCIFKGIITNTILYDMIFVFQDF